MKNFLLIVCFLLSSTSWAATNNVGEYFTYCGKHTLNKSLHVGVSYVSGFATCSIIKAVDKHHEANLLLTYSIAMIPGISKEIMDVVDSKEPAVYFIGDLLFDSIGVLFGVGTVELMRPADDKHSKMVGEQYLLRDKEGYLLTERNVRIKFGAISEVEVLF
jgi:hypothetical protein